MLPLPETAAASQTTANAVVTDDALLLALGVEGEAVAAAAAVAALSRWGDEGGVKWEEGEGEEEGNLLEGEGDAASEPPPPPPPPPLLLPPPTAPCPSPPIPLLEGGVEGDAKFRVVCGAMDDASVNRVSKVDGGRGVRVEHLSARNAWEIKGVMVLLLLLLLFGAMRGVRSKGAGLAPMLSDARASLPNSTTVRAAKRRGCTMEEGMLSPSFVLARVRRRGLVAADAPLFKAVSMAEAEKETLTSEEGG
jgi:hypothetical protein